MSFFFLIYTSKNEITFIILPSLHHPPPFLLGVWKKLHWKEDVGKLPPTRIRILRFWEESFFLVNFFFGWVGCPLSKTIVVDAPLKKSLGFEVWNIKIKWQRSCQLVFEVVVEYRGKKTLGTFYWRSKMKV